MKAGLPAFFIYKLMKNSIIVLLLCLSVQLYSQPGNTMHNIPEQTLKLYVLLGETTDTSSFLVPEFEISSFVTFAEYKKYLYAVRKDSSEAFYLSQLPDSALSTDVVVYTKYINSTEFDNDPVLGISWDNAMNYCKWKTMKDNPAGKTEFVYLLPSCSEWLAANDYLKTKKIKNDLNDKYSDWLINAFDEFVYTWGEDKHEFSYNDEYSHRKSDSPVMKRKRIIGNSFLFRPEKLKTTQNMYHYSDKGCRYLAFRYIKITPSCESAKKKMNGYKKEWGLK